MAKYEIEDLDYESLTSEEADKHIEKIRTDIFEDNGHPYMDSTHPQHTKFVEHMRNLTMAQVRPVGGPFDPAAEKAAEEEAVMDEIKQVQQENLVRDCEAEMDKLVELGFARDEIPDDVMPFQLESLKMERLNAEGKFSELAPLLERELMTLGLSDDLNIFRNLALDISINPKGRAQHIEVILGRMYLAAKREYGYGGK